MEISSIFVGFALFVASLAYVSLPFRQKRLKTTSGASAHATQKGQRDAVLSALHELDFDFKTGKVSEEDYQPLRTQLMAEAAQYIEAEEKDAEQLEALIRTRRAAQQQGYKCSGPQKLDTTLRGRIHQERGLRCPGSAEVLVRNSKPRWCWN